MNQSKSGKVNIHVVTDNAKSYDHCCPLKILLFPQEKSLMKSEIMSEVLERLDRKIKFLDRKDFSRQWY